MVHQCKGCGFHILSSNALCTRCAWSESFVGEKRLRFFTDMGWPVRKPKKRKVKSADSVKTVTDGGDSA